MSIGPTTELDYIVVVNIGGYGSDTKENEGQIHLRESNGSRVSSKGTLSVIIGLRRAIRR